jgi:signal transduction histidine kinase/DNA-binding response OmpR family regulator
LRAWQAQAEQTARWLSGMLLAWLEESYAPLSGLGMLAESSETLTEVEFLNGFDSLESRATAFFLDSAAYLRLDQDKGLQLVFSTDIDGPLAAGAPAESLRVLVPTVKAAFKQPGRILLGPPLQLEAGTMVSTVVLGISEPSGKTAMVLGLVNYDAMIEGLFEQLVPSGLTLQISGKFLDGDSVPVFMRSADASLHSVTTRTISAGADLSFTWHVGPQFEGGVPDKLANFALLAGTTVSAIIALFIGMMLRRNQLISQRIHEATLELALSKDELQHTNFLNDQALGLTKAGYWHVPLDGSGYYTSSKRAVGIFGDIPNDDYRYRVMEDWFANVEAGDLEASKLTWQNFEDAIEGKIPAYDSVYAYKRPVDGSVVWIHAYGTVARDSEGNATDMYGVTQDVTEYVHAQQALNLAKEAADAANQAKSAFLANMSHELRTPMNAILGYSEMLIEDAEDSGQDDFIPDLKKINQAGNHLLALINDVLDLSKIESGKMEAFAEVFDVGALIDQVAGTAQPLMPKNTNRFTLQRGNNLGKACQDLTKLRQSLLNLLSNAAKFTHEGTITLRVERQSQANGDWLSFSVSDTGIGIAADKLDHVFEEFSQADNSTTRDYGGTGLGLTISRRFCQMLGGDLTVTSQLGVGSTFTIRLPAVLPGAEVPQEASQQPTAGDIHASGDVDEAGRGSTILVIDDDAEACEIIRRFLEKDGFNVVTALSGEDGLRLAHQLQPAAITLDVMMPDMDGWSVLRALKVDPVLHNVPVVMLTMLDDKSKGYTLGATDYLTKPVDRDQLHTVLARFHTPSESCSVLLVEDDPATREVMMRTLEKADWQVTEAGNGREALEQLARQKPRLILLDLMMPVMDGFDFLLEMRARAEWQDIPVIVLTAKDLTEEDRRMLSGRVEQIVEKGARAHDQVVNLIRQVVDQHTPPTGKAAAPAQ